MSGRRDEELLARIAKVLDPGETVLTHTRGWAAARRDHVPLLVLGRHRYDVVLTDRRAMMFTRKRHGRHRGEVVLAKRYSSLAIDDERRRPLLLQHLVRTDAGSSLVVEWRLRDRAIGQRFADAVDAASARPAPTRSAPA